jgi:ABC-type transport system involved in multi-copper enzyme maturation permease subunit
MLNPFGPILRFELARIARRQRLTLGRCLYALTIAGIAAATYFVATDGWAVRTRPQDLAPVTAGLFYTLFALQFALTLNTPNWAADAIAGEKERRTLPFLLATPLRDWQIVIGKVTAQVAQVAMFVLAGVPVLCALQFFGGVEPLAIFLGYAALAVTILSLASLTVLCSVYARTMRAAGQRASQFVVGYLFVMSVFRQLLQLRPTAAAFPGGSVAVGDVADWLNAGNPFAVGATITHAIRGGWRFNDAVLPSVGGYLLFHIAATAICLTWASRRLRPIAAIHADGPPPKKRTGMFRPPPRPPVSDRPVLWKALYFDFRQARSVAGRALGQVVFVISFTPLIILLVTMATYRNSRELPAFMNGMFVRGLGTVALCGALVMIAAYTSGCLAAERRKKTLEDLLLTELSTEEILSQKWWASIVVVRWLLVWVGIHWVIAVLTGGLHPLAVPLLVLEWAAYAAFAASLGIYCAARWPKAREAGVWTGVWGFFTTMTPMFLAILLSVATEKAANQGWWFLLPGTVSPPVALGVSGFYGKDLTYIPGHHAETALLFAAAAASIVLYGILAWRLWRGACRRFARH